MDGLPTLDSSEAFNAAIAGLQRQFRAIARNAKNNNGDITSDEWTHHIHGAVAEAYVAKVFGLYCNVASTDRSLPDVGVSLEVRSCIRSHGPLVVRPRDKDDRRYFLVVGMYPNLKLVGWILGKDAKQERFWIDKDKDGNTIHNPYWRVPQSALNTDIYSF